MTPGDVFALERDSLPIFMGTAKAGFHNHVCSTKRGLLMLVIGYDVKNAHEAHRFWLVASNTQVGFTWWFDSQCRLGPQGLRNEPLIHHIRCEHAQTRV